MKNNQDQRNCSYGMLIGLIGITLLVFGFSIGFIFSPGIGHEKDNNNRDFVDNTPRIVILNNTESVNNTAVLKEISELKSILDEDDIWKTKAIALAEDEWNTEKHLYNALRDLNITDIDDKSDINNVIIKETDTSGVDVDDKDCDVEQEVRVYYENHEGDDKRITLIIDTEIVDGEVEDVIYELA